MQDVDLSLDSVSCSPHRLVWQHPMYQGKNTTRCTYDQRLELYCTLSHKPFDVGIIFHMHRNNSIKFSVNDDVLENVPLPCYGQYNDIQTIRMYPLNCMVYHECCMEGSTAAQLYQ
jgi:hypothetical protein